VLHVWGSVANMTLKISRIVFSLQPPLNSIHKK
jgi:hypothetical protein